MGLSTTYTKTETDYLLQELQYQLANGIKADEEDLTKSGSDLKFADKTYNSANNSGYGRKYMRKGNLESTDFLSNTIHIIQYVHDLNNGSITLPENCILEFKGGCLKNGTIIFQNTEIKATRTNIFENCIISGTLVSNFIYPEWFGAIADNSSIDCKTAIDKMFSLNGVYSFKSNATYYTSGGHRFNSENSEIQGNGATLQGMSTQEDIFIHYYKSTTVSSQVKPRQTISNLKIIGYDDITNITGKTGILFYGDEENSFINMVSIIGVLIRKFDIGIDFFSNTWCTTFYKCSIQNCCIGINGDTTKLINGETVNYSNYGENIRFLSCNISNNQLAVRNDGIYDLTISQTSIDYNDCILVQKEGRTKFFDCYIEQGNDQVDIDYWVKIVGDTNWIQATFEQCEFVLANNSITKFDIFYNNGTAINASSLIVKNCKFNIGNYSRKYYVNGYAIFENNIYLSGYNDIDSYKTLPSELQNHIISGSNSGWYLKNNSYDGPFATLEDGVFILSPLIANNIRYIYYDIELKGKYPSISLDYLYTKINSSSDNFPSVSLLALDSVKNVVSTLKNVNLSDTSSITSVSEITNNSTNRGTTHWGVSSKTFNSLTSNIAAIDENWSNINKKYMGTLPSNIKYIRLLLSGVSDYGDIVKFKNIKLCLE